MPIRHPLCIAYEVAAAEGVNRTLTVALKGVSLCSYTHNNQQRLSVLSTHLVAK